MGQNTPESDLNKSLRTKWAKIHQSISWNIRYRPCRVELDDNALLDCVYIINAQEYIDVWGIWPDKDYGKKEIDISQVIEILESPNRLPPKIANKIYDGGESGMGYHIFTLLFNDGNRQSILSGNAVDFVKLPIGKSMNDIVDVVPHEGHKTADPSASLDYYWCLFGDGKHR